MAMLNNRRVYAISMSWLCSCRLNPQRFAIHCHCSSLALKHRQIMMNGMILMIFDGWNVSRKNGLDMNYTWWHQW